MCKETESAFKVLILWPPLARASIACASQRGAESIFRLQPKKRQLRVNSLILHFFGFLHQILRSADPRRMPGDSFPLFYPTLSTSILRRTGRSCIRALDRHSDSKALL